MQEYQLSRVNLVCSYIKRESIVITTGRKVRKFQLTWKIQEIVGKHAQSQGIFLKSVVKNSENSNLAVGIHRIGEDGNFDCLS